MTEAEKERAAVTQFYRDGVTHYSRAVYGLFFALCFVLLLASFGVSDWQAVLATVLYVKHFTRLPEWLRAEWEREDRLEEMRGLQRDHPTGRP